jgi:hypothetical protein
MPDAELASMRQFARTKLKQELLRSMQQTSILSSESVYGLTREEFQSLVDHIRRFRRKVWVVGYVRHPKEYIESQFQQTIKSHDTASLDLESYFPRYRRQLEKLDNVVGADRVRLWLFDPGAFPRGCVVSDFCARLGLDFNPARVIRTNEGLSLPAVRLLYIYRKYGPGYGSGREALQANRELVRRLTELPGPKLRFHSSLIGPVIERRRDELAWLATRTGIDLVEDLERHDDVAVRSEADLLNVGSDELAWLQAQSGHDLPAVPDREDTRCAYVAECLHALRLKLSATPAPKGRTRWPA